MAATLLLIVLERPEERAVFNQALRGTPFRLIYATDGEDGFDRFREVRPDAVIAHLHSPRLDGTILCQLLRQEPGGSIPLLLMGHEPQASGAERARAVGADGYVALPPSREQLTLMLEGLLAGFAAESDTQRAKDPAADPVPQPTISGEGTMTALDFDPAQTSGRVEGEDDMPTSLTLTPPEISEPGSPSLGERPPVPGESLSAPTAEMAPVSRPVDPASVPPPARSNPTQHLAPVSVELPRIADVERLDVTGPMSTARLDSSGPVAIGRPARPDPTTPLPLLQRASAPPRAARHRRDDDSDESTRPDPIAMEDGPSERLLEEPLLPINAMGPMRELADDDLTRKVPSDLIAEIPKEVTPSVTGDRPSQVPDPKKGRLRKGLDESQLGKRLIRRVQRVFALLDELDYYQLLGVEPEAALEQLRAQYFELSLEFHPDRFFLLRSGELKEQIYAIFRRVTEAYGVLSDERRRAAYDQQLADRRHKRGVPELIAPPIPSPDGPPSSDRPAGTSEAKIEAQATSPAARRFLNLAHTAVRAEDYEGARLLLAFAIAYEPGSVPLKRAFEDLSRRRVREQRERLLG